MRIGLGVRHRGPTTARVALSRSYRPSLVCAAVAVVTTLGACGAADDRTVPDAGGAQAERPVAQTESQGSPLDTLSLDALLDSITKLSGEFVEYSGPVWEFSGNRKVLSAFNKFGDSAVVRLVECLDNRAPAAATARDKPVPIGFMCFKALEQVAYYEWHEGGEIVTEGEWAGVLNADATAAQLRSAKQAWQEVVRRRSYFLH